MMVIDPITISEFRLGLVFKTERRGPVFERLRKEVDNIAALVGMEDVFRLSAADIFRVEHIEVIHDRTDEEQRPEGVGRHPAVHVGRLGLLAQRLSRSIDLELALDVAVDGLDDLLGTATRWCSSSTSRVTVSWRSPVAARDTRRRLGDPAR